VSLASPVRLKATRTPIPASTKLKLGQALDRQASLSTVSTDISYTPRKLEYTGVYELTKTGKPLLTRRYRDLKEVLIADNWVEDLRYGRYGANWSLLGAGGYKAAVQVRAYFPF
jgi:hypothetical protein